MDQKCENNLPVRGKQRKAVYNALKQPTTGSQILESVKRVAPSMTYQDLRHILRDFEQTGIATCLNPDYQTGRFYVLTTFEGKISQTSSEIDLCAKVGRAKTRLAVLREIAKERFFEIHPLTATQIKKHMRESYPLGLNHVIAALKFLNEHRLVEVVSFTAKRDLKTYRVTGQGKKILHLLSQPETNEQYDLSPTR